MCAVQELPEEKELRHADDNPTVGLFTSNGIVNYTPTGSRKVLNKLVVLCQALVIGQPANRMVSRLVDSCPLLINACSMKPGSAAS